MLAVELSDEKLQDLLQRRDDLTFALKSNRDRAYGMIPRSDRANWYRKSARDQLVAAHYINDASDQTDYGIANQLHRWSALYMLDRRPF